MQAMVNAKLAVEKDPKLLKAHHRLAQAQLGLERFKAAIQSAQAGQRLLDIKADRTTDFTILMDQIAMAAALKADYAGFDGRILQVSSLQPSHMPGMYCFQSSAAQDGSVSKRLLLPPWHNCTHVGLQDICVLQSC